MFSAEYLSNTVAVKIFKIESSAEEYQKMIKEFENEISLLGSLAHSNIVYFYGACIGDTLAIVMELMKKSLYDAIHKDRPMSFSARLSFSLDISKGMDFLHKRAVWHRDLKPQNILLDSLNVEQAVAKIADFGLAKIRGEVQSQQTRAVGTPTYIAPEVIQGTVYTRKIDVYSFGIVMYEVFTGHKPYFEEKNKNIVMLKVANNPDYRPVTDMNDVQESEMDLHGLMKKIIALVNSCWAQSPDNRPEFEEARAVLEDIIGQFSELKQQKKEPYSSASTFQTMKRQGHVQ